MPEGLTPDQMAFYQQGETALHLGVFAIALIIFLLSVIAVRGLSSWK